MEILNQHGFLALSSERMLQKSGSILREDAPKEYFGVHFVLHVLHISNWNIIDYCYQDSVPLRVFKGMVRSSSPALDWSVVANLLSLQCSQPQWKPSGSSFRSKDEKYSIDINWLVQYYKFVESSENEAGKVSVLCDILIKGVHLFKELYHFRYNLHIIPVGKVLGEC